MIIKLKELNVDINQLDIMNNDVFVDFEFERLDSYYIKFYLYAYVGKSINENRFCLKMIHMVDLQNHIIDDDYLLAQSVIHSLMDSLIEIILTIDQIVEYPKERLS